MGFSLGKVVKSVVGGALGGGSVAGIPGALTGGALGGLSGFMDAYQDKQALKYQNKQNIALWNMQNAYNTPLAQMQRFNEAGLNYNLIYSQSNEAGAIPGATLQNNNSDIGGDIRSANQQKLNTLSTYSNLASAEVSRELTRAQANNIEFQQALERDKFELTKRMLPAQLALMAEQIQTQKYNRHTVTERNTNAGLNILGKAYDSLYNDFTGLLNLFGGRS